MKLHDSGDEDGRARLGKRGSRESCLHAPMLAQRFLYQRGCNGKGLGWGAWTPSLFTQLSVQGRFLRKIRDLWLRTQVMICRAFPLSILLLWSSYLLISLWLRIVSAYCLMIVKSYLIITLPYQKQALVMQTTNLPVYNFSDCVNKRIKRD